MRYIRVLYILTTLLIPTFAWANEYMSVKGSAQPPFGYSQFCEQHPHSKACLPDGRGKVQVKFGDIWPELNRINDYVNRLIKPVTDQEKHDPKKLWGIVERWELLNCHQRGGDCRGDCEEYVLLKRHLLMEAGWPASALLVTVGYDNTGQGHAVLTVRTTAGDFILDNRTPDVLRHDHTRLFTPFMRQSTRNPKHWYYVPEKKKPADVALSSWGPNVVTVVRQGQ